LIMNSAIRATIQQAVEARTGGGAITAKINFKLHPTVDAKTGEIYYNPDFDAKVAAKIDKKADKDLKKIDGFVMKEDGRGGFVIASKQVELKDLFAEGERV